LLISKLTPSALSTLLAAIGPSFCCNCTEPVFSRLPVADRNKTGPDEIIADCDNDDDEVAVSVVACSLLSESFFDLEGGSFDAEVTHLVSVAATAETGTGMAATLVDMDEIRPAESTVVLLDTVCTTD
jgi:hypothetical protein